MTKNFPCVFFFYAVQSGSQCILILENQLFLQIIDLCLWILVLTFCFVVLGWDCVPVSPHL